MNKYKILIEGNNFQILENREVRRLGFYTTRFIQAVDVEDAKKIALELIRAELKDAVVNEKDNPPLMFIDKADEILTFGDNLIPGSGFTWFKDI